MYIDSYASATFTDCVISSCVVTSTPSSFTAGRTVRTARGSVPRDGRLGIPTLDDSSSRLRRRRPSPGRIRAEPLTNFARVHHDRRMVGWHTSPFLHPPCLSTVGYRTAPPPPHSQRCARAVGSVRAAGALATRERTRAASRP